MGWDEAVLDTVVTHRTGLITEMARGLMAAGQPAETYAAAAAAALALAWWWRGWWAAGASVLAAVAAAGVAEWAKDLVGRARPPEVWALVPADGWAMPSSIGALTAAAATPFVLLGLRRATAAGRLLAAVLVTGTGLVGAAMVYLGAHWPSDVLAGWALGVALGLLASAVLGRVAGRLGRRAVSGTAVSR
jgi:undecaprenyl-diphosphatase